VLQINAVTEVTHMKVGTMLRLFYKKDFWKQGHTPLLVVKVGSVVEVWHQI